MLTLRMLDQAPPHVKIGRGRLMNKCMNKYTILVFSLLAACSPPTTHGAAQVSSAESSIVQVSAAEPHQSIRYCEFALGQPVPDGKTYLAKESIPTEGDERDFYDYRACDNKSLLKAEVANNLIISITLQQPGDCLKNVTCVGNTYEEIMQDHPNAKLNLSRLEGKTFSLLINENVTAIFDPLSIPDACYDDYSKCENSIKKSKSKSVFLHES